jgi:hypothetical protein
MPIEKSFQDRHEEFVRKVLESTISESELPCPRLELRWRKLGADRVSDYNIVIPITSVDIRKDMPECFGSELRINICWTTNSGGDKEHPLRSNGIIDTPYRDSAHAAWDSYRLGLPAFVVWDGRAQSIEVRELNDYPPVEEDTKDESPIGWAQRMFRLETREVRNKLGRFAKKILKIRDSQHEGGWGWLYLDALYNKAAGNAPDDYYFPVFRDWVAQASEIEIEGTHRVCSVCGAEVPEDITEACEHVFEPSDRALLKERG